MPLLDASGARQLVRSFRDAVAAAQERGYDWRSVVDAVRPLSESLWRRLPRAERSRFDRHVRGRWELRRHRAPQAVTDALNVYRDRGRLRVYAGRVRAFDGERVEIALAAGATVESRPRWIVNCTGPARGAAALRRDPLAQLVRSGALAAAPSGRGVVVDESLHPVSADGTPVTNVYVVGPLAGGSFFESTAVPELRLQARTAAEAVVREHLASRPLAAVRDR
jgi:uncharacterized NAD(P)/FAD-binding protein YdhS